MSDAQKDGARKETPVETLERLAKLARIRIPEDRKDALAAEFESVVAYIGQLDELDISIEKGASHVPASHNVFRDDANPNETGAWTEEIVKAFPSSAGDALTVKKIISHD